jgi:hypothetical protein
MAQPTNPHAIPPAKHLLQTLMTRTIVMNRGNDSVIRVNYIATEQSVDDARENVIAMRLLSPRYPALLLVDTSLVSTVPPAVRSYYLSKEVTQVIGALALLVDSLASRLGGNILLHFYPLQIPTRLFTDESLAVEWLQSQRQRRLIEHTAQPTARPTDDPT